MASGHFLAAATNASPAKSRNSPNPRWRAATFLRVPGSVPTNRTTAGHVQKIEESDMNAVAELRLNMQRVVCMALSAVIVAGWISLGAYTAESASHDGYSVTITQLE